jgi:hypothetical protein
MAFARPIGATVAIGRDHGDAPPSRGVFKGEAASQLAGGVSVRHARAAVAQSELARPAFAGAVPRRRTSLIGLADQQHHQQQQQQQ